LPTEKPPLRLAYEPDDYLCTWTVPYGKGGTVELPGNLEVRANLPPRGSIYGSVPLQLDRVDTPAELTNETPLISSVRFLVAGLDAILGSAPIKSVKIPGTHPDSPKDLWSALLDLEATREWEPTG